MQITCTEYEKVNMENGNNSFSKEHIIFFGQSENKDRLVLNEFGATFLRQEIP